LIFIARIVFEGAYPLVLQWAGSPAPEVRTEIRTEAREVKVDRLVASAPAKKKKKGSDPFLARGASRIRR
jgi:hypothetical protein